MSGDGSVVVVGGTRAIGREIARHYAATGRTVVLTGRDPAHVAEAVDERRRRDERPRVRPVRAARRSRRPSPTSVRCDHLVLAAIDRDDNSVAEYDIARAIRLVTLKLVGYTEVVHTLLGRLTPDASILLYGGHGQGAAIPGLHDGHDDQRRRRRADPDARRGAAAPAGQLDPSRHRRRQPVLGGQAGGHRADDRRDPTGRLATMADIVDATVFLLENPAVNGVDLIVDGGWHCR